MSLRPLDMQVMIPKTPEMSSQKQIEQQKVGVEQQYLSRETQKQANLTHQQIIETKHMENNTINSNEQRGGHNFHKQSKKHKKKKENKEHSKDRNSTIDIRI